MNKPIPDQKQRDMIARELETSFFVEAGAGSGKTHSLIDRMAGIIRRGYAGIENVVAVTFTRKAASELSERFQIRLERTEKELHDGETEGAKPGDFMIIAKRKDMLSWYARDLEKLGIPYEISGGESFTDSTKLREVYKVLKAVAGPKDPVALIAALRGSRSDMTGTFPELVEYLHKLITNGGIEEMSLFPCAGKSVRILNLHKAKGLEAPVVILADPLGVAKDHEPQLHVKRTSEHSVGYFLVTKPKGEYGSETIAEPREWERYANDETLYNREERNRLDYIAATRAKNILIVSVYEKGERKKAWESFYSCLQGAPQLETGPFPDPRPMEILMVSKQTMGEEEAGISHTISFVNEPTYRVARITELTDKRGIFTDDAVEGASWGRIIHKALEACGRGKRDKLEILVRNWLTDEGRLSDDLKKVIDFVDVVIQSEMWKRVLQAEEKYFEVPFSSLSDGVVIYGIIDLIFKESDGWVVVDYKTDNFETNLAKKEAYERQLAMYAGHWEKITGDKVKEKRLFRVAGVSESPAL